MFQKEFKEFSKIVEEKIKNSRNIGIYFDSDADGCSAAALLVIYLLEKFKKYPILISCYHDVDEKLVNSKEDLIFVLDAQPKKFDSENIIIIDHHVIQNVPKKSFLFNPLAHDKKLYIATSCLVYNIIDKLIDISKACWVASIGIKADRSEETCEKILSLTYNMYPEFKKIEGKLIKLTSTSRNIQDASIVVNSLIECYNIGSPSFFGKTTSSAKLVKINKKVDREVEEVLKNLEKILETKNTVIFKINSSFNVQSLISNKISINYPNKNIIIFNSGSKEKVIHSEVRSKEDALLEKLCRDLKDLVEDIGGHKKAFGFSFIKENLPKIVNYFKNTQ